MTVNRSHCNALLILQLNIIRYYEGIYYALQMTALSVTFSTNIIFMKPKSQRSFEMTDSPPDNAKNQISLHLFSAVMTLINAE